MFMSLHRDALSFKPVVILALILAALLPITGLAAEPFRVGVNNNDRPFCMTDERGELTGFSVDVARAICKSMKADCRLVATTFAEFLPSIQEGRLDFIVANVLRTAEREKVVDFSKPFWRSASMFIGKPGAVKEISAESLKGKRIAVHRGSVQEKYLRSNFPDSVMIHSYASNIERNTALVKGEADLIFGSTVSHFAFLSTQEGTGFDFLGKPMDGEGLGGGVAIPLAKGRPQLRQQLDDAIDAIVADGTFARISRRYFGASMF